MASKPQSNDGTTSGTTAVTVVNSPPADIQRVIRTITLFNNNNAAVTATLTFVNDGTSRVLLKQTLQPDDTMIFGSDGECLVLDTEDKSVKVVLGASPTTQCDWTAHYLNVGADLSGLDSESPDGGLPPPP